MTDCIESAQPDELEQQRTIAQNRCLHQYFECLAEALNAGGFSIQEVFTLPISPTKDNVKTGFGHVFMKALYPSLVRKDGSISTADLNTKQIQFLYENINAATAEKFGISLDWPDRFNGGKCS